MMTDSEAHPGARTALAWLASVSPDPDACRREWERNPHGVAPARREALGRPDPPR